MMYKICLLFALLLFGSYISFSQNNTPSTAFVQPNSFVYAMARHGSTLYIGGDFTSVGSTSRVGIAAIDLSNNSNYGTLTSFYPIGGGISGGVITSMALNDNGSLLYIGGNFTSVGGQTRNRAACINTSDNSVTSWNPNANNNIEAMAISGTTVYLGGWFSTIGGGTRNRIAAIDANGTLLSFDPNANGTVYSLALDGTTLYAGGNFTTIGGGTRNRIAAISTSGTLQSFDPNLDGAVKAITVDGSTIYVGGTFEYVGGGSLPSSSGQPTSANNRRAKIAAFNKSTSACLSFDPNAYGDEIKGICVYGSSVYIAGRFSALGGGSSTRYSLAGVNSSTGAAMPWNPGITSSTTCYSILMDGSTIYVGGSFTSPRNYLASFANAVLPVTWQTFTAEKSGAASLLKWSTGSEQNTKDYEIQHSTNTVSWTPLGTVAAAGNSTTTRTYSFVHSAPFKGNIYNYYRILQRDLDGQFSYSKIASLIYDEPGADIIVYPNPTTGSFIVYLAESKEVKLINVVGATVWRKALIAGRNQIDLNTLTKGVYWLVAGDVKKQILLQ